MIELDDLLLYVMGECSDEIREQIEADPTLVDRAAGVREALEATGRVNLKLILMELGNRLVTEHGFPPTNPGLTEEEGGDPHSTDPIFKFTVWLNNTPEAREELKSMGVDWPV